MNLFQYFYRPGSRKVAFGIVLFAVANLYFFRRMLTVDDLMTCIFLSTALIGGGTIADSFMKAKTKQPPEVKEEPPKNG